MLQCRLQQTPLSPEQLCEAERKLDLALGREDTAGATITRLLVTGAGVSEHWKPAASRGRRGRWFVVDMRRDQRFFAPFGGVLGAKCACVFPLWSACECAMAFTFSRAVLPSCLHGGFHGTDVIRRSVNIGSESALTAIFGEQNKEIVRQILEQRRKAPLLSDKALMDAVPPLQNLQVWKEVQQFLVY